MGSKRINIFFERHIGFGVRWDRWAGRLDNSLAVSLSIPFVTIEVLFYGD